MTSSDKRALAVLFFLAVIIVFSPVLAQTALSPQCGNHVLDPGEQCDGGFQCNERCELKPPVCGNGKQEVAAWKKPSEECDLGKTKNGQPGVECSTVCTVKPKSCGNGKIDEGESCDWGPNNGLKDMQCFATCELISSQCGNKKVEIGEECDDGNSVNNDGCSTTCKLP